MGLRSAARPPKREILFQKSPQKSCNRVILLEPSTAFSRKKSDHIAPARLVIVFTPRDPSIVFSLFVTTKYAVLVVSMAIGSSPHTFPQPSFPTLIFINPTAFPGSCFPIHSFLAPPGPRFPKSQPKCVALALSPKSGANTHYGAGRHDVTMDRVALGGSVVRWVCGARSAARPPKREILFQKSPQKSPNRVLLLEHFPGKNPTISPPPVWLLFSLPVTQISNFRYFSPQSIRFCEFPWALTVVHTFSRSPRSPASFS